MRIAIVKISREFKSKFSAQYQCVKVKDLDTEKIYTLNIGSLSSLKWKPYLKDGAVFHGVRLNPFNKKVIDVKYGFTRVSNIKNEDSSN